MTATSLRGIVLRACAWMVTGVLAAAMVCALIVIGTSTALRHHGVQVGVVLSGSMTPTFKAGDAVLIQPRPAPGDLRAGQVITYRSPGEDRLTTHRIHALIDRPDGLFLQTKGDANPAPDANFTPASAVVGIMGRSIPNAGTAVAFYSQPRGRLVVLGVPLAVLLVSQVVHLWRTMRTEDDDENEPQAGNQEGQDNPGSRSVQWRGLVRGGLLTPSTAAAASRTATMTPGTDRTLKTQRTRQPRRSRTAALVLTVTAVTGTSIATSTGAVFAATAVAPTAFATANDFCTTDVYDQAITDDSPTVRFPHGTAIEDTAGTYSGQHYFNQAGHRPCSEGTGLLWTGALTAKTRTKVTPSFSIETWIKPVRTGYAAQIVGFGDKTATQGDSNDRQRVLYLTSAGKAAFSVGSGANTTALTSPTAVDDNQWHHLVATYTPTTARLYVDGTLVASRTTPDTVSANNGYWRVGTDTVAALAGATNDGGLTAIVDETVVYGAALAPARIAAHYAASGR